MIWTVRLAEAGEIDAIVALERSIPELPHWSRADYAEAQLAARSRQTGDRQTHINRVLLVAAASDSGDVAGFAVAAAAGPSGEARAELESLAVHPGWRRHGLARRLCMAVIAWSRAQGAAELTLEVRSNSAGALALYSAVGFAEVGRRPRYYANPADDAALMRMVLS